MLARSVTISIHRRRSRLDDGTLKSLGFGQLLAATLFQVITYPG